MLLLVLTTAMLGYCFDHDATWGSLSESVVDDPAL